MNDEATAVEAENTKAPQEMGKVLDWKAQDEKRREEKKKQKMSQLQAKRMRQYAERRQRLINAGVDPKEVDKVIAEEDYEAMSDEMKIKRLEMIFRNTFQQFAKEFQNLRHNDGVLADAMDINFKGFGKILTKLGVAPDEQKVLIEEAKKELEVEREAQFKAQQEAAKKAHEEKLAANEKKAAEEALKAAEGELPDHVTGQENHPDEPVPEGATEFGG